jgi:hypothetical protein
VFLPLIPQGDLDQFGEALGGLLPGGRMAEQRGRLQRILNPQHVVFGAAIAHVARKLRHHRRAYRRDELIDPTPVAQQPIQPGFDDAPLVQRATEMNAGEWRWGIESFCAPEHCDEIEAVQRTLRSIERACGGGS